MTPNNRIDAGETFLVNAGQIGVLVSRGFAGTTSGMRPVSEHLICEKGGSVAAPFLTGRGVTPAEDWIRSLEELLESLQARCKYLFVA